MNPQEAIQFAIDYIEMDFSSFWGKYGGGREVTGDDVVAALEIALEKLEREAQ